MQSLPRRSLLKTSFAGAALLLAGQAALAQPKSAELDQLLSKQAITELIYQYPRALDRLDRELLLSIAHADAKVEFGKMGSFPSWAAFADWLIKAHQPMLGNNHRITNVLVQVKGDRAVSESSGTATLLVKKDGADDVYEERWMHSRYLDKWSRRDGRWALDHRQTVTDYRRVLDVAGADVRNRYQIGARTGRDDPSYRLFKDL
ncbi:MAG: nuclear transport factor 2 family protein [Burkholderiaceae bacterium]|nr:nuclear transport factor 2 family protein [Burkholderiaceae bacterium]